MKDVEKRHPKKNVCKKNGLAKVDPKTPSDLKKRIQQTLLLGGGLSALLAKLFPQLGDLVQRMAYGFATALMLASGLLFYIRKRQTRIGPATPAAPANLTGSLFRNLNPIEDGESLLARDHDVQDVWTLIQRRDSDFAVIWGESGCGKTSLLRAGIVPLLRTKGFRPIYLPRPTVDPVAAIEAQIAAVTSNRHYRLATTVIIIDQFEEIFLAAESGNATQSLGDWIRRGSLKMSGERVMLVVSIRLDQFVRLQSLSPSIPDPTSKANCHHLRNFRREEAKKLIDEGIKNDHVPFEASLVEKLLDDLTVSGLIRPAELQLVATELKQRRHYSRRAYDDLGGAKGILTSYVSETVASAPKSAVAIAMLRSMCVPGQPLKSAVDFSAVDLLQVVQQAVPHAQQADIDVHLRHLIAARIVIQSEIEKYNLIHDLFAELIQQEARASETRGERADRLLRKHLSDQRSGASTRIPTGDIALIIWRGNPALRRTPEAQRLLWKSAIAPIGNGLGLAVIVAVLGCAASYTNVYLSTAPANYQNGAPYIVLRSGHPSLKFLPFVGTTELDTGFSMADVSEDSRSADDFPRETLTSWRFQALGGLPGWTRQILERQSKEEQVSSYRLLDQPRAARDQAVRNLRGFPTAKVALSLSLVGSADPSRPDSEGLEGLLRLAEGRDKDFANWGETNMMYDPMTLSLAAVFMAGKTASLKAPPNIDDLLSQLQIRDGNETLPRRATFALMALAQSTPSLVGPATIDRVLELYKSSNFESKPSAEVLLAFGDTSASLGAYCLDKLIAMAAENLEAPDKLLKILLLAEALANDNPPSVGPEALAPFKDIWERSDAGLWAIPMSVIARANPNAIPSAAVAVIKRAFEDSAAPKYRRDECAIAMVRLGSLRQEWVLPAANEWVYELAKSDFDEAKIDGRILEAKTALAEYYAAFPQQRQDLRPMVKNITKVAPILSERVLGPRVSARILMRTFGNLESSVVTENDVMLLWALARFSRGEGDNVIGVLSEVADTAPEVVLSKSDMLYSVPRESAAEIQKAHNLMVAVVARAWYVKERSRAHNQLAREVIEMMLDKSDRNRRVRGTYGAFFLMLDDAGTDMKDELRRIFHTGSPIAQYVAGQALEMISLAELYQSAKLVPSKRPLLKVRLRLLEQYADLHLQYAAGVILTRIECDL